MFNILCLETNELVKHDLCVLSYDDGKRAQEMALYFTEQTGKKHQVRRAASNGDWKKREQERLTSKFYERPSWIYRYASRMIDAGYLDRGSDHFLHVSKRDPAKVAFTQDENKGNADIQTPIRVGAYLTEYCPKMSPELIREIALEHANIYVPRVLKIATNPDEIERIYKNGPNSCMSKSDGCFQSSVHPTRVYGDSDLALAYVENADGNITGRALIWPEKKVYGRIYGDYERMNHALTRDGYSSDDFNGAKVRAIYCGNTGILVMPYLDGIQRASLMTIEGTQWVLIDENGDIDATSTNGLIQSETCENCGDTCAETFSVSTSRRHSESWCESCQGNHAFYCEGIEESVSDQCAIVVDGKTFASWYREGDRNYCEYFEEYTFDETIAVYTITNTIHRDFASYALIQRNELITEQWRTSIVLEDGEAFKCRIDGNYWKPKHMIKDDWTDEPRSIANYPKDMPLWYGGKVAHNDVKQMQLGLMMA
jgi:hypothetical protein